MKTLDAKITDANRVIDAVLANYRRPAVMWSSGKDSQVLLFLLRARQIHCPVIFHRFPFHPEKYEFAERMIREWGLEVYDWAPSAVTLQKSGKHLSLVQHYQVGRATVALPLDIYEPLAFNGGAFVCGARDGLMRPTGSFNYPWDAVFLGHKGSDVDPLWGPIPLGVDVRLNVGAPDSAYPLRQWTDADVWDYSWRYDVPQQWTRYDKSTGEENKDRRLNPDWHLGCTRCLDRDGPAAVWCPKLRVQVSNLAREGQIITREAAPPTYCAPETKEGEVKTCHTPRE